MSSPALGHSLLDPCGRLLQAAFGFAALRAAPCHPAVATLHRWLDSWRGLGDVVVGRHRQRCDVQLPQYDERGWRATFYTTGMEHSATERDRVGVRGDAVAGGAAQRAACEALQP